MRRKVLIAGLVVALAPLSASSQQQNKVLRVGVLVVRARPASPQSDPYLRAFLETMRGFGYVEGRNIHYEWRFAGGDMRTEHLDALV